MEEPGVEVWVGRAALERILGVLELFGGYCAGEFEPAFGEGRRRTPFGGEEGPLMHFALVCVGGRSRWPSEPVECWALAGATGRVAEHFLLGDGGAGA